jgi:hypothetical protein
MWGDVDPISIEFAMMSRWRAGLEKTHGRSVAHKTLRVWRSLWTIMQGMKVAIGVDPSRGVRNRAPAPRHQRWSEGEAVRLVKGAWRRGYRGLACVIATSWDTQFSPVDVRTLKERHRAFSGGRLVFDRQADGRAKTGRAAIGTVSRRTERLVFAYLASTDRLPDAVLFRSRSGSPYREATLAHDFGARHRVSGGPTQAHGYAAIGCGGGDCRRRRCGGIVREAGEFNRPIERPPQDLCASRYRGRSKHR